MAGFFVGAVADLLLRSSPSLAWSLHGIILWAS